MSKSLGLSLLVLAACAAPRSPQDEFTWNTDSTTEAVVALADGPTDEAPAVDMNSDPNSVRVLVGWTTERGDGAFTIGGQYEYRFRKEWGAGAFADLAFGDSTAFVAGVGLFWHPIEHLNLMAGPGIDFDEDDFLVRVGGAYEFDWKGFGIGPAAYVDLGGHGTPVLIALQGSYDW